MFQVPRDTVDVPVPPGRPGPSWGTVYQRQDQQLVRRPRTGPTCAGSQTRRAATTALKAILGELYGLDIQYYVEVNFQGFKNVVDTLGGVTDQRPDPGRRTIATRRRRRTPPGLHPERASSTWTAPRRSRYARSRHGRTTSIAAPRQQRVLLSLREQADPQALIPRLPDLVNALGSAISTDIPTNQLAPLLGLASQVDTKDIRSYVFAPPLLRDREPPGARAATASRQRCPRSGPR